MKALIIVDMQNDFLPGGALAVQDGDVIIPLINSLQKRFDLVVATQDWHPADHKSFASAHPGKKVFDEIILEGMPQTLWPDHCVQATFGSAFTSLLDSKKIEAIFRKGMEKEIDSYSGFFDNGKRKSTGMGDYLKGRGITKIYVTALQVIIACISPLWTGLNSDLNPQSSLMPRDLSIQTISKIL